MTLKIAKDSSGEISPNLVTLSESYFGSQWAILKSNVSLVTKASRQNQKFTKMKGQVQRNLDRNKGDGTNLVDDKDLLNILANYQV